MKITSSQHKLSCDCLQVEALPARAVELLGVESRLYCFEHWGTDQVLLRSAALMTLMTPAFLHHVTSGPTVLQPRCSRCPVPAALLCPRLGACVYLS